MPLQAYSKAREERRLIVLLYIGTLVVMLILLYATWKNMRAYQDSAEAIRRYNFTIIELEQILGSVQDQETGARGFMLTNDPAYLVPFQRSESSYLAHLAALDSLYQGEDHRVLEALRDACDSVRANLAGLIFTNDPARTLEEEDAARLLRAKRTMDRLRALHALLLGNTRAQRERLLSEEEHTGMNAPTMIILYSLLALSATALLFWRLTRSLNRNERMNVDLNLKVLDLAKEVTIRQQVQGLLEKVQDTSPNGIMTFSAIRNTEGTITDFMWLSSNRMANQMVGRTDLVGKRLLEEMPTNGTSGLFDEYVRTVESGRSYRSEFQYDGEGVHRWFSNHAVKLDDGFMVTFTDITDHRLAQELTKEAERVELTGQITRTVAHEVRNPLTNIHLAVEQLHDEVLDREEVVQPFFAIIQRNLQRIGTLIREMLESSQKRELNAVPCKVEDVLERSMKHVSDRLRLKDMKGTVTVDRGLPLVYADCELLDLAITNLAVNAIEAMEPGKGDLRFHGRASGDEVLLDITDNGRGIAPENIERLFQPFYSGRPGGLGLGLTTTRSILHGHGIGLDVRSVVGKGSTFTLRFHAKAVLRNS